MAEQSGGAAGPDGAAAKTGSRWAAASQILLILSLWVCAHPFYGVIHDARLYMVQALEALEPGQFSQDLFFRYGSQDPFTAFTAIYKHVVATLGPAHANLAALVVGQTLWLGALAWLTRTIFAKRVEALFAIAAVAALHSGYGGGSLLHYAEPFVTPRLFAEALVLAAMALAWRGRALPCALVLALAAALHPLIAVAGVAVIVVFAALHDRRVWILIALGVAAVVALAVLGVGPFGRALTRFDDAWLAVVWRRCAFVFISRWVWWDLCQVAAVLAVLAGAWGLATAKERRLLAATLLVTVMALVAAVIGADIFHDVLIANLQPWRALWLATVISNAFLAVIVLRAPAAWASRKLLLAAAFVSLMSSFFTALVLIAPILVLVGCAVLAVELIGRAPLSRLPQIVAYLIAVLGLGYAVVVIVVAAPREPNLPAAAMDAGLAVGAVVLLVVVQRAGARVAMLSAAVLAGALTIADRREPWEKFVLSLGVPADLRQFVAGAGKIYWEGDPGNQILWHKLREPSYFSCIQGAGAMFFRATAMDFARRSTAFRMLKTRTFTGPPTDPCPTDRRIDPWGVNSIGQLTATCKALPDLDTVILNRPVPGLADRAWHAPAFETYAEADGTTTKVSTFHRYACAPLREGAGRSQ